MRPVTRNRLKSRDLKEDEVDVYSRRMRQPKAIDLFCGAGGLTQGLKRAGFRVVGAIDNDELATDTYRENHSGTVVWQGDIRRIAARDVRKKLRLKAGSLQLLAGCPPCQAFSTLTTLNGRRRVRDRRTKDLLFHFLRFVRVFKPRTILLENVPGLAKDARLATFRNALVQLGYTVDHKVINAADYAVPQRRRRLILVATRTGAVVFARRAKSHRTVADALKGLKRAGRSGDPLHDVIETRSKKMRQLIRRIPKNGGSRSDVKYLRKLACHRKCNGFRDVYGRMSWNQVAPTITSGCVNPSKGRFLHPSCNRAITLREAALLQTFHRRYKFSLEQGKFATARLIGNALPPELVRRQATALFRALARSKSTRSPHAR